VHVVAGFAADLNSNQRALQRDKRAAVIDIVATL
jgi:hypothetical protein